MDPKNQNKKISKRIIIFVVFIVSVIVVFVLTMSITYKDVENLAKECSKGIASKCQELENECDENNKDACYELAIIYSEKGLDTLRKSEDEAILFNSSISQQYLEKANFFMIKACKLGHKNACLILNSTQY